MRVNLTQSEVSFMTVGQASQHGGESSLAPAQLDFRNNRTKILRPEEEPVEAGTGIEFVDRALIITGGRVFIAPFAEVCRLGNFGLDFFTGGTSD